MLKNCASQETKDFFRNDETMQKILKDSRLTCKAKGLFVYMYTSSQVDFSMYDLVNAGPDGADSVRGGIDELVKYKYIKYCEYKHQHVYLITFDNIHFKIGKSDTLHNRFKTYETHSPFPLQVIHTIKTKNMNKLESELLKMFKSKRIKSEWFKLDECDIDYIKSIGGDFND